MLEGTPTIPQSSAGEGEMNEFNEPETQEELIENFRGLMKLLNTPTLELMLLESDSSEWYITELTAEIQKRRTK